MPLRDVVRTYDQAVFNWVLGALQASNSDWHSFDPLDPAEPKAYALTFASPERPFARPFSQDALRGVETWPTPHGFVERQSLIFDAPRWNFNKWPAVVESQDDLNYLMSKYPPPFNFPYQVDVRCRYQDSEGAPVISSLLQAMRPFYYMTHPAVVLNIDFKQPWGHKRVHLMATDILNNSDLETGESERWLRFTVPLMIEGWMFITADDVADLPDPFGVITFDKVVKEVISQISSPTPFAESIGVGDGATVTFTGILSKLPVALGSLVINSGRMKGSDNYQGSIVGPTIAAGSINYDTGAISVTFRSAPGSGQLVDSSYEYAPTSVTVSETESTLGDNVGY